MKPLNVILQVANQWADHLAGGHPEVKFLRKGRQRLAGKQERILLRPNLREREKPKVRIEIPAPEYEAPSSSHHREQETSVPAPAASEVSISPG